MKRSAPLLTFATTAAIAAVAAMAAARPLAAEETTARRFSQQIEATGAQRISLDVPVGEMTVEGWDQRQVQVDVRLLCRRATDRCLEAAKAIHLVYRTAGDTVRVEVKGWPKFGTKGLNLKAHVSVPRDLPLAANLGVGEMNLRGLEGDVDGDVGVGQMNVSLDEAAIAQANLDTGIGEANLSAGGQRYQKGGLFGREIRWKEGRGRSKVRLNCGVGEIDLDLK
jgi:hypothetical protein